MIVSVRKHALSNAFYLFTIGKRTEQYRVDGMFWYPSVVPGVPKKTSWIPINIFYNQILLELSCLLFLWCILVIFCSYGNLFSLWPHISPKNCTRFWFIFCPCKKMNFPYNFNYSMINIFVRQMYYFYVLIVVLITHFTNIMIQKNT